MNSKDGQERSNSGQRQRPPLAGTLQKSRSGALRILLIVTGIALLRALLRAVLGLLGLGHRATVQLKSSALEIRGERRLLGVSLGERLEFVPLSAIRSVSLVGESPIWAIIAGVLSLVVATAMGTTLVLWGVAGRQPSWVVFGLLVIGGGILLDVAAFLLERRGAARGLATLEIRTKGRRLRLLHVDRGGAESLVAALEEKPAPAPARSA